MIKKEHLEILKRAKISSKDLINCEIDQINEVLLEVKNEIIRNTKLITEENKKDLENFKLKFGEFHPNYDRLVLTESRIMEMAEGLDLISKDKSLDNEILEKREISTDVHLEKTSIPFGTILVIYESRPNVTIDVFGLCFKSKNVALLRGGKEAFFSNSVLVKIIKSVLTKFQLNEDFVNLLTTEREEILPILKEEKYIDLCIPRGSKALIEFVRINSKVPTIETGAGVVHAYLDDQFDEEIAKNVIFNSKTRRVSVCNSLDCLIINKKSLDKLAKILKPLEEKNVILYCDEEIYKKIKNDYKYIEKLTKETEGVEFLDYKMSCVLVENLEEAIEYISKNTSFHTELIITENQQNATKFQKLVDASVVYVNTSTGFTDGFRFGLGAEIGISTQKLHARGPMGLLTLRTYKYKVNSNGAIVVK